MKSISRFFKSIENFLNICVDYFDERVRTGKFIGDIKILIKSAETKSADVNATVAETAAQSPQVQKTRKTALHFYAIVNAIPVLGNLIAISIDKIRILLTFYAEIFIVFAVTFPTAILLVNFFTNALQLFFIALFPVILFDSYCLAALYYCIQQGSRSERISLWTSFHAVIQASSKLIMLTTLHYAIALEVVLGYFIFVLFFGYFFDAMGSIWGNSFIYWFVVVFLGSVIVVGILVLTMVMNQAYFYILEESISVQQAIKKGWNIFTKNQSTFMLVYFLITFLFVYILYWAGLYYLYTGAAITLFCFLNAYLFIGFLLRRRLAPIEKNTADASHDSPPAIFLIIIFFGLINYILTAILISKDYTTFTTFIQSQRTNFFFSKELDTYANQQNRYTLEYPHGWTIYEWNKNSVTFYTNYTGTTTGGVWLTINVTPYSANDFRQYYDVQPGLISLETDTKEIIYKVSNISIQGYEGVSYTVDKPGLTNPEYQTHYLIHKNNQLYEITFTTENKNVEGDNKDIFDRIINSFRFVE